MKSMTSICVAVLQISMIFVVSASKAEQVVLSDPNGSKADGSPAVPPPFVHMVDDTQKLEEGDLEHIAKVTYFEKKPKSEIVSSKSSFDLELVKIGNKEKTLKVNDTTYVLYASKIIENQKKKTITITDPRLIFGQKVIYIPSEEKSQEAFCKAIGYNKVKSSEQSWDALGYRFKHKFPSIYSNEDGTFSWRLATKPTSSITCS